MRYLIRLHNETPFLSKWYDYDNNFTQGMVIYDLKLQLYTDDGHNWFDIEEDHL